MRGLPLYSPATHLHGFCSLPNLRGYYIKKILLAKVYQAGFITPLVPFAGRQFIKMINNQTINIDPHIIMLNDENRLKQFYSAMKKVIKSDTIVLDIGGGSGILTFFAALLGAKKIYCVEKTKIIHIAQTIAKENNYKNITFIHNDIFHESTRQLINDKVDVIVCELIGTTIFDENILEVIAYAKEQFLAPKGIVIPNKLNVYAKLVHLEYKTYSNTIEILKQFGITSEKTFNKIFYNSIFQTNDTTVSLESSQKIHNINLDKTNHQLQMQYTARINEPVNALMFSFKAFLDQSNSLDTKTKNGSHWGNFFIPLEEKTIEMGIVNISINVNLINRQCYYSWNVGDGETKQTFSNMFVYR